MNPYEVMLTVDGQAVVRTEWALNAMDACQMAIINASADALGMAKSIRVIHIGPPQAEILRASLGLATRITEAALAAMSSAPPKGQGVESASVMDDEAFRNRILGELQALRAEIASAVDGSHPDRADARNAARKLRSLLAKAEAAPEHHRALALQVAAEIEKQRGHVLEIFGTSGWDEPSTRASSRRTTHSDECTAERRRDPRVCVCGAGDGDEGTIYPTKHGDGEPETPR